MKSLGLEYFFELSNEILLIASLNGEILRANQSFEKFFGQEEIEIQNKNFLDFVGPNEMDRVKLSIAELLINKNTINIQTQFRNQENEFFPFNWSMSVKDGLVYCIGQIFDNEHQNEMLNTKKELYNYKTALDKSAIIAITDARGVIKHFNFNFEKISGFTREEILGKTHRIIKSGYHSKEFFKDMWDTISSGKVWHGEIKNKAKDGREYWVDSTIIPFLDENGKPYEYCSIRFEITNAKRATEMMLKAKEEAESANRAKTEFLTNMSHEIRTPLNGVIGYNELLMETELNEKQRQYARDANTSAHALLGVIDDILDFSKIEAGHLELEIKKTFLYPLLDDCLKIVKHSADRKNLLLDLISSSDLPEVVYVDPFRLKQVLVNLLGNAIKFTEAGKVTLEVNLHQSIVTGSLERLSFQVSDSGIGISEEQQNQLFKVFSQADNSITRKFGGTGLGLVISSRLVEKMGGRIGVKSVLGKGSIFSFEVPLVSRMEHPPKIDGTNSTATLKSSKLLNPKILVAEDNALNAKLVQAMLKKSFPKSELHFVQNGSEVLGFMETEEIDIILMDLHMPILDGISATRQIRKSEQGSQNHVYIIALTAGASSLEKESCINAGMDDFLTKPIINQKLAETLQKYVGT